MSGWKEKLSAFLSPKGPPESHLPFCRPLLSSSLLLTPLQPPWALLGSFNHTSTFLPQSLCTCCSFCLGFPGGSVVKNPSAKQESWVRSPGREGPLQKGMGNPFQYSCLRNPMDRGLWWAPVHGVTKSQTRLGHYRTTATTARNTLSPDLPQTDVFSLHFSPAPHPAGQDLCCEIFSSYSPWGLL